MKKYFVTVLALGLLVACNKQKSNQNLENQSKQEQSTNENSKQENKIDEFVFRSNDGVMKIRAKLDANTFKPEILQFQDKGSNEMVDLKIIEENTANDRLIAHNPKTNEKYEFSKDFMMVAVMYKDGKEYTFNREVICYSKDGKVLTTSGGPMFLPFFYSENEKENPKEVQIADVTSENHPKYPNDSYFKGTLPNGKKVDIIAHSYAENNPKTKITLIIDGKEIVLEEK